jgi:type IV secretory pathway TrbF-like protein
MATLSAADKTTFLSELNIVSNDTGITFSKTGSTDTAFEFVSDTAVALHEKYLSASDPAHATLSLTLKKYIGNAVKEADVKANLPYPPPGNINASVLPKIYSDIFLTI